MCDILAYFLVERGGAVESTRLEQLKRCFSPNRSWTFERKEHDLGRPLRMSILENAMSMNFSEIQRKIT